MQTFDESITLDNGLEPATASGGERRSTLGGLFEDASNFEYRYIPDLTRLAEVSEALKKLGVRVVLTSGTFDIIHQGHSRYLEAARMLGGFLIVGVDSDDKVRARKGPKRPAVPEDERLLMVTHQRGVGAVTLKHLSDPHWALIEAVRPDVLVATEDTYTDEEIAELVPRLCGRVEVMPRMATVSTSNRLRDLQMRDLEGAPTEPPTA